MALPADIAMLLAKPNLELAVPERTEVYPFLQEGPIRLGCCLKVPIAAPGSSSERSPSFVRIPIRPPPPTSVDFPSDSGREK